MKSWLMQLWLQNHDKSEWPDLSICQTGNACHVADEKKHPDKESIEKMCSEGFFAKHNYIYVHMPVDEGREGTSASCPSKRILDKPSRDNPVPGNLKARLATTHHEEATCSEVKERECNVLHYTQLKPVRPAYDDNSLDQDFPTYAKPAACISEDETGLGKYQNKKDCIISDKPATNLPEDSERNTKYQNTTGKMHQDECTIYSYDKPTANNDARQNHTRNSALLDLLHDPRVEAVYVWNAWPFFNMNWNSGN